MKPYIHVDFKKTKAWLDGIGRNQIPFAAALTLTRLAQESQGDLRQDMGKFFTLRSERRLKGGIRIKPARKADFKRGTMYSEVKDIDRFMALHVIGGTKKPFKKRYVAIPSRESIAQGVRTTSGAIKAAKKPSRIASRIKAFKKNPRKRKWGRHRKPRPFMQPRSTGQPFIAERIGPERLPLRFLWGFSKAARVEAKWPFFETAYNVALKKTHSVFTEAFTQSLRTAKTT